MASIPGIKVNLLEEATFNKTTQDYNDGIVYNFTASFDPKLIFGIIIDLNIESITCSFNYTANTSNSSNTANTSNSNTATAPTNTSSSTSNSSSSTNTTTIQSSLPESDLGISNVLCIILIAIGVLLILLAIAILIRLGR